MFPEFVLLKDSQTQLNKQTQTKTVKTETTQRGDQKASIHSDSQDEKVT